ncbi:hypothetical protein Acr_03g0009790 [Actinidia rufa]|uniref:Retrotransposon Copia-like N-terminal domain-containing protein n=1 Tax=Actinidia rufa TaxID=165716 RepID=A0A7J0ECP1_9ERIC|nr:hypothetical protein Acr_03g0009790 [Actinidia rufa]
MTSLRTTWSPNSFQLRLALNCRKSPVILVRMRVRKLGRQVRVPVGGGSARSGNGVERRSNGNSWKVSNSSVDAFSGWSGDDGGEPSVDLERKRWLGGFGAGAAGVILVTGLTFATLSLSKRNTSRPVQEMQPLTTQEEVSLASDDQNDRVEQNEEEGKDMKRDDCFLRTTAIDDKSVAPHRSLGTPVLPKSEIGYGSFVAPNFESSDGSLVAEKSESDTELKANLIDAKPTNLPVFDSNSTDHNTDHQEGVPDSSGTEISNFTFDATPSSAVHIPIEPPPFNNSVNSPLDAVLEPLVVHKENGETVDLLSEEELDLSKAQVSAEGNNSSSEEYNLNGDASIETTSLSPVANPFENEQDFLQLYRCFLEKVLVPAVVDQVQGQVLKIVRFGVTIGDLLSHFVDFCNDDESHPIRDGLKKLQSLHHPNLRRTSIHPLSLRRNPSNPPSLRPIECHPKFAEDSHHPSHKPFSAILRQMGALLSGSMIASLFHIKMEFFFNLAMEESSETSAGSQPQIERGSGTPTIHESSNLRITTTLFNGQNYLSWSRSAILSLKERGKLGYVNGTITAPPVTDSGYGKWDIENSHVINRLVHSVVPSIGEGYLHLTTAKDIWDALADTYSRKGGIVGEAAALDNWVAENYGGRGGGSRAHHTEIVDSTTTSDLTPSSSESFSSAEMETLRRFMSRLDTSTGASIVLCSFRYSCGNLARHEKVQPLQDVHEEAQRRETESMHNDRRDVAETSLFRSRSVAVISPVVHTRRRDGVTTTCKATYFAEHPVLQILRGSWIRLPSNWLEGEIVRSSPIGGPTHEESQAKPKLDKVSDSCAEKMGKEERDALTEAVRGAEREKLPPPLSRMGAV